MKVELANSKKITINAHQVTIMDTELSIEDLNNRKLTDVFNAVRLKLKQELIAILQ